MADLLILEQGVWKGHPSGYFEVTEKHIDSAIAHFKQRGIEIPVDLEHYEAEAYGWITDLYKKDGSLYAAIRWNEAGKDLIDSEKYQYMSPSLWFEVPDEITGDTWIMQLFSLAITNYPFMSNLPELQLQKMQAQAEKRHASMLVLCSTNISKNELIKDSIHIIKGAKMDPKEILGGIAELLGVGPDEMDKIKSMVAKLVEIVGMFPSEGETPATPEEAGEMLPELMSNSKAAAAIATLLKCDVKDLETNITTLQKEAKKVDNKASDEATGLKAKITELEEKVVLNERKVEAAKFIADNSSKIPPHLRETVEAKYVKDPEFIKEFYKDAKPIIDTEEIQIPKLEDVTLTKTQKEFAKLANVTEDAYKKQYIKDLARQREQQAQMQSGGI